MKLPGDVQGLASGRVVGIMGTPGTGKTTDLTQIVNGYPGPVWAVDTVGALTGNVSTDVDVAELPAVDLDNEDHQEDLARLWERTHQRLGKGGKVLWNLWAMRPVKTRAQLMQQMAVDVLPDLDGVLVVMDEAHKIIGDSRRARMTAPDFSDWITERRNQRVPFVYASQRPALVDSTVRGVTDFWIWHALTNPLDLDKLRASLKEISEDALPGGMSLGEIVGQVQSLGPGQVFVVDFPAMRASA